MTVYNKVKGTEPFDTYFFNQAPYLIVKNKKVRPVSLVLAFKKLNESIEDITVEIDIDHLNQALHLFPYLAQEGVDLKAIQDALKNQQTIRLNFNLKPSFIQRYKDQIEPLSDISDYFKIHNTTGQSILRCLDRVYSYKGITLLEKQAA